MGLARPKDPLFDPAKGHDEDARKYHGPIKPASVIALLTDVASGNILPRYVNECTFENNWRRMMALLVLKEHGDPLPDILRKRFPEWTGKRALHVAYALIHWLGSNMGDCFLRKYFGASDCMEQSFEELWFEENKRNQMVNNNKTLLEWTLHECTPRCPINQPVPPGWPSNCGVGHGGHYVEPVSIRDEAVAKAVMKWLDSRAGIIYLRDYLRRTKAWAVIG